MSVVKEDRINLPNGAYRHLVLKGGLHSLSFSIFTDVYKQGHHSFKQCKVLSVCLNVLIYIKYKPCNVYNCCLHFNVSSVIYFHVASIKIV